MADLMITEVEQDGFVPLLDDLHAKLHGQRERCRFRPALVMRIGKDGATELQFAILLHNLGRLRP